MTPALHIGTVTVQAPNPTEELRRQMNAGTQTEGDIGIPTTGDLISREAAYSACEIYPELDYGDRYREAFLHGCMACRDALRALPATAPTDEVAALRAEVERLTHERDNARLEWRRSDSARQEAEARIAELEAERVALVAAAYEDAADFMDGFASFNRIEGFPELLRARTPDHARAALDRIKAEGAGDCGGSIPSDGTCQKCGCAPTDAEGFCASCIDEREYAALTTQARSTEAAGVKVKPLVWETRDDIEGLHNSESPIGWWYNIHEVDGGFSYEGDPAKRPQADNTIHSTLEDAKAAAQADYERRILSALTTAQSNAEGGE